MPLKPHWVWGTRVSMSISEDIKSFLCPQSSAQIRTRLFRRKLLHNLGTLVRAAAIAEFNRLFRVHSLFALLIDLSSVGEVNSRLLGGHVLVLEVLVAAIGERRSHCHRPDELSSHRSLVWIELRLAETR